MCLAVIEQCGAVKKTITYFQDNSKGGFYEIKSVDVIITVCAIIFKLFTPRLIGLSIDIISNRLNNCLP